MQRILALCVAIVAGLASMPAGAESIKIGISHVLSYGGVPVALERGYFKAEGLDAELVFFDSAQPIAVATVSGDVDFGIAGPTAAFYRLAGQGAMRIIAGANIEMPGFRSIVFVASKKAYEGGLKSLKDLAGHSVAITQIGTPLHYDLAKAIEKHGVDLKSVRVTPLQSNSNVNSALTGGQVDAASMPVAPVMPLIQRGDVKVLGWASDEVTGTQGALLFTATKTADAKADVVRRFVRAYAKGARDYHDAFADENNHRRDGPLAPEVLEILAKFAHLTVEQTKGSIAFAEPDGRVDEKSVLSQIDWYKSQNMLPADLDGKALIDRRFAQILSLR
jgi:NitT/TauT family transport system substrate-binding protein